MAVWSDETFEVLENVHEEPTQSFRIRPEDNYRMTKAYEEGRLLAFLHSHPQGNPSPSPRDYLSQLGRERGKGLGWTYGIVPVHADGEGRVTSVVYPAFWGDAVDRGPLLERPYLWGITDCFSLLRDWHKERGIYVPDAPRIPKHWEYPEGSPERRYFSDWIGKCGFVEVSERHLRQPGDSFTFSVNSNEPDHCGVYLGEANYLHHPLNRLSEIYHMRYEDEVLAQFRARFWRLKKAIPL